MNTLQIPDVLNNLISKFINNKIYTRAQKIIQIGENDLYYIIFDIGSRVDFDSNVLEDSHEKYIIYSIENFIKKAISQNNYYPLDIKYNFNNSYSYNIVITIKKINLENEFIFLDENFKNKINKEKDYFEKEKNDMIKYKNKRRIYTVISQYPGGVSLGEIIQKTRRVYSSDQRLSLLQELIDENKIMLEIDTSQRRKKKIYKPI